MGEGNGEPSFEGLEKGNHPLKNLHHEYLQNWV